MQSKPSSLSRGPVVTGLLALCGLLAFGATAQTPAPHGAQASQVYRCPGPPVLYTDALSPKEAQEKGCRTIEGTPVSVVSVPKPRAAASGQVVSEGPPSAKVDPALQKARDSDRRGVLERELREAEAKLGELQKEYANGQPERRGDERNYQKYLDRVADLKASISRQEADIAAIKREIAKLP
ncbi:hypothetical protein [Pelomonas sp. BJYL3]|uniref:hypothetical protein n=1 Tax=Pelomonas sp. BJYL3 TaxID=2976697 RepID=UPI0022B5472A|nr:hypothetical protein [Pelomonas sp. BJYL3]